MFENILISISIGFFVFILQKTDFAYEYLRLFAGFFKSQKLLDFLNITGYEKSGNVNNFIIYLASFYGMKKDFKGFFFRLISCFVCLSTFINCVSFMFLNPYLALPGALISITTYFLLFLMQKKIYS